MKLNNIHFQMCRTIAVQGWHQDVIRMTKPDHPTLSNLF